jgi:hypothetical protein
MSVKVIEQAAVSVPVVYKKLDGQGRLTDPDTVTALRASIMALTWAIKEKSEAGKSL